MKIMQNNSRKDSFRQCNSVMLNLTRRLETYAREVPKDMGHYT